MQELQVLINGKPVRTIGHEGRTYIVASPGTQYEVRLKNDSSSKVKAVCSIDGLSVLDGEKASEDGAGYLINGFSSFTVKGWRTSNDEVKAFEFSTKDNSYAAKGEAGDASNCGVIGCVFWSEKSQTYINRPNWGDYPWWRDDYRPRRLPTVPHWENDYIRYTFTCNTSVSSQNQGSCDNQNQGVLRSNNVSAKSFDLGTKFSDKTVEDKVESVTFEASQILSRIEIYYASKEQLKAMGVPIEKAMEVSFPQAFGGYCKPPSQ